MCVFIFSITFILNLSHSKKNGGRYNQKCIWHFRYSTRYACHILTNLSFLESFFKKILKYQISLKIGPVGAELFPADRRTDMTKLMVAFRNLANASTNTKHLCMNDGPAEVQGDGRK